jgi:hypothetical protein
MIEDPAPTDSVIGACEAAIREGQPKVAPPGTLYHLTDVDGLSGIAGNKCLWASLATTLNDCQEIRYGVALAEEVIEKRLLGRRDEYHSSLLTYVRTPHLAPKEVQFEYYAFIAAFCKTCSKSGQWLHYGRSGRGVAIGFSPAIAAAVKYELVEI